MRAIRIERFGPPEVLSYDEVDDPAPGPGEVRVRVHAAALNPKDVLVRKGKMSLFTGRSFPLASGYDLAGVVDALGPGVGSWSVGRPVYGVIQSWRAGACAELALVPADQIADKPAGLTMVEAAAVPLAALTALQALRDLLRVREGTEIVVNGASGGVGVFAIQLAKIFRARVLAVCSEKNASFVEALGADEVLAYDRASLAGSGRRFDAIFDVFGTAPYERVRHLLQPRGRYVTTIPRPRTVARDLLSRHTRRPARLVVVKSNRRDLEELARWIDAGRLAPVIDHVWPIEEAAQAHAYLETKRARGKVVLEIVPRAREGEG